MSNDVKVIRPAVGSNGKISAVSMILSLSRSGVPLSNIALVGQLTAEQTEEMYELLNDELDAINYSSEPWTQADLDRQAELITILEKAGRL